MVMKTQNPYFSILFSFFEHTFYYVLFSFCLFCCSVSLLKLGKKSSFIKEKLYQNVTNIID